MGLEELRILSRDGPGERPGFLLSEVRSVCLSTDPFNSESKNRERIFCSFEDDFEHRLNGTISKEGCAVHKSNCLGPSKNIKKEFIGCRGNLMVLGTDNNLCGGSQLTIDQIPETYTFANNKFKLVGLIGGNNFHFVSYIKCPKN